MVGVGGGGGFEHSQPLEDSFIRLEMTISARL